MKGSQAVRSVWRMSPKVPRVFLVTLLALLFLPVVSQAANIPNDYNFGPGPSSARSQGPAQSLRMTTAAIVPGTIKPGFSFLTGITEVSIWGQDPNMVLDFGIRDTRLGGTYGVIERLGLGLFFDNRHYYGGIFDQVTLNFHDILGIDQNGRDEVDKYLHRIIRYDDAGNVLFETNDMEQFDHSGISLGAHYVLTFGSDGFLPAIGLTGIVRYATESPPGDEDNPVGWSIGSGISKRLSETWYLYSYLSYTSFGQETVQPEGSTVTPIEFTDDAIDVMIAGAWQFNPKWAFLVQYSRTEGALEDFNVMSEASNEVNLGVKWKVSDMDALEITLIENVLFHDNSPDIGLVMTYAHHFGE
jgi:hypothetical protein